MRLLISAPHGRSGKTTITMGLAVALREKGLVVQSFKKGPDYIDPSWLTEITGRPCRNLDLYFMDKSSLRAHFDRCCSGADLALIEGAMGLYDGLDLHGSDSTAAVAQAVGAAVLLVVDCTRMTRSAAALVKGFNEFDADTGIAAVILNQVARPRHEDMLRRSIEEYTGIPVIGAVPRQKNLHIADRHLGLVPAGEMERTQEILAGVGRVVDATVDLQALLAIARTTAPLADQQQAVPAPLCGQVRIGVVKDRVFSFYYPENLEALAGAGAELVYIDSLHDQNLPSLDGLYIGGGFPEIYARELEANQSLRDSIRRSLVGGLTAYAECGGLMYLSRRLHYQGQSYEMCGVLPCETKMSVRPKGHGYSAMVSTHANYLFPAGRVVKGHEFHHSCIVNYDPGEIKFVYQTRRGYGADGKKDGIAFGNVIASYQHIYAPAAPEWAVNFVAQAAYSKTAGRIEAWPGYI